MRSNNQLKSEAPNDRLDSGNSSAGVASTQRSDIGLINSKKGTGDVRRRALARTQIEILAEERALRLAADGLF